MTMRPASIQPLDIFIEGLQQDHGRTIRQFSTHLANLVYDTY